MTSPAPHSNLKFGLILGLLAVIGSLTIDMYLPALPSIADEFGTSIGSVQRTLTAYLIGFGLAQLFYGPISDQVGRKIPLYVGLGLFTAGTVAAYLAPTVEVLTVSRVVQGLGGAVVMVIPRAVIRDIGTGVAATRLMGMVMMVISVSPMVAPLIGSGVMLLGGWRAIFLVLALMAGLSLLLTRFALPETLPKDQRVPFNARTFGAGLRTLLTDTTYLGLTFIGAFGMASFFVFFASASFVYTGEFGLTPVQFSLAFALNGLSFFLATQVVGKVAERFGMAAMIKGAVAVFASASVLLAILTYAGFGSLPVIIALLFLAFGSLGFVVPTTMVMAIDNHGSIAGLASSLGGTLQVVTASGMIALSEPFFDGTALPMVSVIAVSALIALILSRVILRNSVTQQTAEAA